MNFSLSLDRRSIRAKINCCEAGDSYSFVGGCAFYKRRATPCSGLSGVKRAYRQSLPNGVLREQELLRSLAEESWSTFNPTRQR